MNSLQVVGETIYFLGQPVAKITIPEGMLRDRFLERMWNDDLYEACNDLDKVIGDLEYELYAAKDTICLLKKPFKNALARMAAFLKALVSRKGSKPSSSTHQATPS